MHDVVSTTDTCGMDLGRYLNISAAPNDGVLSAAAALVVLVVLFWALMPQFWQVTDDLAATAPAHTGPRSHGGPNDATFPIPRTPRVGAYQRARVQQAPAAPGTPRARPACQGWPEHRHGSRLPGRRERRRRLTIPGGATRPDRQGCCHEHLTFGPRRTSTARDAQAAVRGRRGRARRDRAAGMPGRSRDGRRRRRLVGDVPGRAQGLPGAAGGRQRRGVAGDDRAPQGDRRHPRRGPPRGPGRRPARATRAGDGRDLDLATALAALPRRQREAVAYHYLAGLPYAEVAAITGGSADAARRAASDGIARLRRSYPRRRNLMNANSHADGRARCPRSPGTSFARCTPGWPRRRGRGLLDVAYRTVDTPVGRCCWPPPQPAWSGWPSPAKTTTRCWPRWPPDQPADPERTRSGWTTRPASSTNTSPAGAAASTCRWTSSWRPGSAGP